MTSRRYIICLINLLIIGFLSAQEQQDKDISFEAFYKNDEVRLRWLVQDREKWEWGNQVGYNISRKTISTNGTELSSADQIASQVVLASALKPMSASEIDTDFPDNINAQVAKGLLYDPDINQSTVPSSEISLAKALELQEKSETKHLFALLSSEFDYDAAKALGLAFTDDLVQPDHEYQYKIDFAEEPPTSYDLISDDNFEDGWGIWEDGGTNCVKVEKKFATSPPSCVLLRNTGSTAEMFTNAIDLTSTPYLRIKFAVYHFSVEADEKFHVEVAPDGVNFETIKTYTSGIDFSGNDRLIETIIHNSANFSSNTIIRFRAEASANDDHFYFDDIELASSIDDNAYTVLDYNQFMEGWGIWNDGGSHCVFMTYPEAYSGKHSILLRNGDDSSAMESDTLALGDYNNVSLEFTAYVKGLEDGEYLQLLLSTDNGDSYRYIKQWTAPYLENNTRIFENIPLYLLSPGNGTKLKFQLFANENNDQVYLDDVRLKSREKIAFFTASVNTSQDDVLSPIEITNAFADSETATIEWSTDDPEARYSSYNIERSEDGVNFTKLNEEPFVFFGGEESDMSTASYTDSLPTYDQTYIYRVCGKSSFGYTSPPSDTVHVEGVPPRLNLTVYIDTCMYHEPNDNVSIHWLPQESSIESQLTGFDVFRAKDASGPYIKMNTTPLENSSTSFPDIEPLASNYYMVYAYDEYNVYKSQTLLYLRPDSQPPAIPTVESVNYNSLDELTVSWLPVNDDDINGYRVFHSNGKNGNYVEATKKPMLGTSFSFYIDLDTEIDSLYVTVLSEDERGNQSEFANAVGVNRPDIYPPSPPALVTIYPSADGIKLAWRYSPSEDTETHILQRRATKGPNWVDVLEIPNGQQNNYNTEMDSISFIDSMYQQIQEYEYRMLAVDGSNNTASSQLMATIPTRQLVSGHVSNVSLEVEGVDNTTSPRVQRQLKNLGDGKFLSRVANSPSTKKNIIISWTYPLDPNLKEFKIYRAMSGESMIEYRTVDLSDAMGYPSGSSVNISSSMGNYQFSYTDEETINDKRYVYEIKAVHKDGTVSNRSSQVSKKLSK